MTTRPGKPVIMALGGLDPSGADGIAADILTIASTGGHCAPVVTVTQARDTQDVKDQAITPVTLLIEQVRAVLEHCPVAAIKIADLGDTASIEVLHTIFTEYPDIPLILSPVSTAAMRDPLRLLLLPRAELVVLNAAGARDLAPAADSPAACARELLDQGAGAVLVTGAGRDHNTTRNQLFTPHRNAREYSWDCLPALYQGAACTLSAAIACYRAHEFSLAESVQQGQQFTWQALRRGYRIGMGRLVPDRLYWSE